MFLPVNSYLKIQGNQQKEKQFQTDNRIGVSQVWLVHETPESADTK